MPLITKAILTQEALANPVYSKLAFKDWDTLITSRGINHIDDANLAVFVGGVPDRMTETYERLDDLNARNPSTAQWLAILDAQLALDSKKIPLTQALRTVQGVFTAKRISNRPVEEVEEARAYVQEAANKVAAIDGKIDALIQPLRILDEIKECERWIGSVKGKFACAIKEQELRKDKLVSRTYAYTTYYMDFTPSTHSHLTGIVTFTNASATVSGSGCNFDPEVTVGDYIRQSDGTQWYKVTVRTDDNTLTITPAFQQATHTDDNGASFICSNDGLSTDGAFPHLNRYTTDTVRTAGDILKVRANQTHVIAGPFFSITFDEDGTVTAYDEIRGCSVADDPFSDSSDVQPIFDFGATAAMMNPNVDDYWRIFNITVKNNNWSTVGLITFTTCVGFILDTCTVYGNANAAGVGVQTAGSRGSILNCTIYGNKGQNIYLSGGGYAYIKGCVLNGGVATTDYGVYVGSSGTLGIVDIVDTTIGSTTAHDISSLYSADAPIYLRNSTLAETVKVTWYSKQIGQVSSDDDGQVLGAQSNWQPNGTITKSSTIVRVGGGTSSALMMPAATYCTVAYPLTFAASKLVPDFAVWCPASITTITVYLRANTIWTTYPTAAQLFIQADYYAGATALRSQSTASTQTLIDNREPAGAGVYTADAGTDTTHVVDAGLVGSAWTSVKTDFPNPTDAATYYGSIP